jgi:hypothetical protein
MARRKSWTALFYIVAKNLDDSGDAVYINSKAAEVAARVRDAASRFPDMYVAFQVVFDPEEDGRKWFAELLNADDKEPTTHLGNFVNPGPFSGDTLTEDLLGFYAWALPRCPADHVAVFFWGHSAGPAGLFEPALHIVVPEPPSAPPDKKHSRKTAPLPSLNSPAIHDVLRKIRIGLSSQVADRPTEEIAELILKAKIEDLIIEPSGAPLKVDVILFQDCWMSTLETAFELKDAAHFTIGSQSLVPFGKPAVQNDCDIAPSKEGIGVWPYGEIFDCLATYNPANPRGSLSRIVDSLGRFYDDPNNIWPNPSVPFSLLDLDTLEPRNADAPGAFDVTSLNVVVSALQRLEPTVQGRAALIAKASIAVAGEITCLNERDELQPATELAVGTIALVDLMVLCNQLKDDGRLLPDEIAAVERLLQSQLVVSYRESIYKASGTVPPDDPNYSFEIVRPDDPVAPETSSALTAPLGFRGVGAFYYPAPARLTTWKNRDTYIIDALSPGFYLDLALSQETNWKTIALDHFPT